MLPKNEEYYHKYYLEHREVIIKRSRKWALEHPKSIKIKQKKYDTTHKVQINKRHREAAAKNRLLTLNHYGGNPPKCQCPKCNELNLEFLTIDHIYNNGNEYRKAIGSNSRSSSIYRWLVINNYPLGYRVLCMNCNWGRNRTENKQCPHELE